MGGTVDTITGDSSAESSFRELDDVFLQTQTRIWIGELLHTRLDEQLHISELLADGELLFEVSKVICKMLLAMRMELRHVKGHKYKPFGSRKKSGRYTPYSNVDSFLKICKILGMNGIDLFSPSDIVEKRDIRKVCMCVRSFSKKARSKQLNVPDFDMVTSMVAMPTDMVGCIRRSLELSQCSSSGSVSNRPSRSSKSKFRQKKLAEACGRNYDSYSEGSYDMESNYTGLHSHSSSTDYSLDTASLKISDLENSPGASSVVKTYTLAHNKSQQSQCESECLASVMSLHSRDIKNDHQLDSMSSPCIDSQLKLYNGASHLNNRTRHNLEIGPHDRINLDFAVGNGALAMGNPLDDNTEKRSHNSYEVADSDCCVVCTDYSVSVPFDGEDSMFNLYVDTDSHGSSLYQSNSQNGFGRKFSDDIEDVEVSSTTSMSSVSSRMLKLDFDDCRTDRVNFIELQNYEADRLDKSYVRDYKSQNKAKCEVSVQSLCPDTDGSQFEMKFENFGFSAEVLSTCSVDQQSYATEYEYHVNSFNSEIGMSQADSSNALWIKGMNFVDEDNEEVIGAPIAESDANIKNHPDNCLLAACHSNVIDICEDSSDSCNIVAVKGSEKCQRVNGMNDGSGLQDQGTTIHDISSQGVHSPRMVSFDDPAANPNFIVAASQCKPTVEKHPHSVIEASDGVGEKGHQACTDHKKDLLYCAEYTKRDEENHEDLDNLEEEISDGRERVPQGKPSKKPLLKRVVKGTAFFGVLLLLLHLRRRGREAREKTGETSKKTSQIQKSSSVEFSSEKGQKGDRVNGIYPAGKLKFGN